MTPRTKAALGKKGLDDVSDDELYQLVQGELERRRQGKITGDEVRHHEDPNLKYMVFPQDLSYREAFTVLERKVAEEEKKTAFKHVFKYRPDDGLVASAHVFRRMFGMTLGKTIRTFFGDKPPEMVTVKTSLTDTLQVPTGHIEIPHLENTEIYMGPMRDKEMGLVFVIQATGPNKYRKIFDQMFAEIEKQLQVNSIYRGKAVTGADQLDFIDHRGFDASKIVLAEDARAMLSAGLFAPIQNSMLFEHDGVPLKRSVLLYGPYGTGKSSIGLMTAQVAEQSGWTYLAARTGRDKIEDVLRTARLYQPCVVFVEDVDTQSSTGDPMEVSRLLEAFDGITAKDTQIIMVLTTNHVEKVHKGMLRPGRLDYTIEIGALDRKGVEELIRIVVSDNRIARDTDFDAVFAEMGDFEPAFVKATADRAKTFALARTGSRDYVLNTQDLVLAARSLHQQLELLKGAKEGAPAPTLDTTFKSLVSGVVQDLRIADSDGDVLVGDYVPHKLQPVDKDDRSGR